MAKFWQAYMGFDGIVTIRKTNDNDVYIEVKSGFLSGTAPLNDTEIRKLKSFAKEL